jgi:hypothetical protein
MSEGNDSMSNDDEIVHYAFVPGEEPTVYTADICAEVGHERCKGIETTNRRV